MAVRINGATETPGRVPSHLSLDGLPFFCSWSGGKDSCLALHHAIRAGGIPAYLLTMMTEAGDRSRSHGLTAAFIERQSRSLRIPSVRRSTTWPAYEDTYVSAVHGFRSAAIRSGIFGDIDIPSHRQWCERTCAAGKLHAFHPLWQRDRRELLDEFLALGFSAVIVAVREGMLDPAFLGRTLDRELVREFDRCGIDASGENGEYHTAVTGGPLFSRSIGFSPGQRVLRDGCWFLDMKV